MGLLLAFSPYRFPMPVPRASVELPTPPCIEDTPPRIPAAFQGYSREATHTKPTAPRNSEPQDLRAALNLVIETDEARARAHAHSEAAAKRPHRRYLRHALHAGLLICGAWALIAPPDWLMPAQPDVPEPVVTAHTLAVVLVGRAQEVVTLYRGRGELPATLAELSPVAQVIHYRRTGAAAFELRAKIRDSTLLLPVSIPRAGSPRYKLTRTAGFMR
jgi:hypothetical protein